MKNVFYCFLALCLLSCQPSSEESSIDFEILQLDLDGLEKNTSANLEITKFIPLETQDSSIFGMPKRISYLEDRIYVLDLFSNNTLFLFDGEGNFVRKIRQGKGPGECLMPYAFFVDEAKERVLLWDEPLKRLNEYDLELNYKTTTPIDIVIRSLERTSNGNWLVAAKDINKFDTINSNQLYSYLLYNSTFDKVLASMLPLPQELSSYALDNPISREKGQVLFSRQFDNNIFTINANNELAIRYKLDFGKYNITSSDQPGDLFKLSKEGKRVVSTSELIHTDNYLAFSFFFNRQIEFLIYAKNQDKYYYSKNLIDLGLLPRSYLKGITNDGVFYALVEPFEYLEYCKKYGKEGPMYPTVEAGGNMLLMFFKMEELPN